MSTRSNQRNPNKDERNAVQDDTTQSHHAPRQADTRDPQPERLGQTAPRREQDVDG